jgi:SpoVK/Ycf46/Vps4 family AAA+-type ATPase
MSAVVVREMPALWDELERVLAQLERHAKPGEMREAFEEVPFSASKNGSSPNFIIPKDGANAEASDRLNPLARLRELFGLTNFETDALLLCAGFALDRRIVAACAAAQPDAAGATVGLPTFGLAASVFEEPHWSASSRLRPLRYWRLLEMGAGPLLHAPLEIDERVLHYLLSVPAADERLEMIMHPLACDDTATHPVCAGIGDAAVRGALHWRQASNQRGPLLLMGGTAGERTILFRALCREAGVRAWSMDSADLPEGAADRERLARAFTRESALWPVALLIRTGRLENANALEAWLERVDAPIAVEAEACSQAERLSGIRIATPAMSAGERKALWVSQLGPLVDELLADGEQHRLDAIVETFALDATEIRFAAEVIHEEAILKGSDAEQAARTVWDVSRAAARRSLDDLAARVDSFATWEDLVLPEGQLKILHQIVANARQSSVVLDKWGFAQRHSRGLGLSALFAGASGTGKTMAASIVARELDRDLYQIDLATVVSKYIGETEKHLRRIFDAAERSGAILLFDEADALFGKRSQVRDSHDRYANLEISYLLQRMESYRGIAILTTNMQNAMDTAFQRRLRFVVQFPFPDQAKREQIWRKVFPASAPTEGLNHARLAQLNVTGGVIRNIALLAAFLAADEESAIATRHVLSAARTEFAKLEKPLSAAETRGWE